MARWKAGDEYIPNLTSTKKILKFGSPESRGEVTSPAMWEVHLHQERRYCDIEHFIARTETNDGALESW